MGEGEGEKERERVRERERELKKIKKGGQTIGKIIASFLNFSPVVVIYLLKLSCLVVLYQQ